MGTATRPMDWNVAQTRHTNYQEYRTCKRKKVYANKGAGWAAVRHIQKNGNDPYPDFELRPYQCDFCGAIHVGHSNTPKSSEARMRERATSTQ